MHRTGREIAERTILTARLMVCPSLDSTHAVHDEFEFVALHVELVETAPN